MTEFFNMGGYAFFVWTSYGITALVLIANIISANSRERQIKRDVAMRLERQNNASSS
jgi:heme exporter protein D